MAVVGVTYAWFAAWMLLIARDSLAPEFFFDEAWRSDFIRSASLLDRYRTHNTPMPLGWLWVMRAASALGPDGFRGLRVTSLLVSAPAFVLLAALVHHAFREMWGDVRAWCYGVVATTVLLVLPGVHLVVSYLNDYLFQVAATAAVVLLWLRLVRDDRTSTAGALLAAAVALPVATISGMFVLPAVVVDLALRIRSGRTTAVRMWQLSAGAVATLAVALATYLIVYRSVVDEGIESFWARVALRENGWGAVEAIPDKVWAATIPGPTTLLEGGVQARGLAELVVVVLTIAGLAAIGRRCPRYVVALASAAGVTVLASAAVAWPLTPERVNLPVWALIWLGLGVGAVVLLDVALRHPLPVVAVAVAALVALFPAHRLGDLKPFAMGLHADLQPVRDSPVEDNVVLSYHPMAHFYVHDGLVNEHVPGREFAVVRDEWDDAAGLLGDPDAAALAAGWEPGDAVWCVIPFEYGEATLDACDLSLPGLERTVEERRSRAVVVGWLPSGA